MKRLQKSLTVILSCIIIIALCVCGYVGKEIIHINKILKSHETEHLTDTVTMQTSGHPVIAVQQILKKPIQHT